MVREAWTKSESDGLVYAVSPPTSKRGVVAARGDAAARPVSPRPVSSRLANTVLSHLPIGIAVIDKDARLLFWNEEAARLFGIPPLMVAEMPPLAEILIGIVNLTAQQRDGVLAFIATHIEARRTAEPNSCLRLSLGRDRRIAMHVREIGANQWMLVIDDGTLTAAAGTNAQTTSGSVAWLDALTGLANRRTLNQKLRQMLDGTASASHHALLLIDLDGFKAINDGLGHPIGDALLCLVSQRLRRETRDDDLLVRLGGDEFVMLMTNGEQAEPVAGRLINMISHPYLVEGQIANIGASIGIVHIPEHGTSCDDIMRHAELALLEAKRAGGRIWRMFEPTVAARANARRDLETGLRKALVLGELSLAYQPRLNLRTRTLTGFEALARWCHPVQGNIPPAAFIAAAEEIGCIADLGEWVLRAACHEAARWPLPVSVAVNVSRHQFADAQFLLDTVEAALNASGLSRDRLELEITESAVPDPDSPILETLHRFRASGIHITLDDVGASCASLSRLCSSPFSRIKIDRRIVARLGIDDDAATSIRAIATLGAQYGVATIAKGVETAAHAAAAEANGCSDIQGFLLSRPMPPAEIDQFLRGYTTVQDKIATKIG